MALADLRNLVSFRGGGAGPAALAVVVAVLAWFGIRSLFSDDPTEEPPATVAPQVAEPEPLPELEPPVYPELLVASQTLQSGVMLNADRVEWREWRDEVDLEAVVLESAGSSDAIFGSVTRRTFPAGTPIFWDGIIIPGSPGFIGAVLQPGMRAIAVAVDRATTGANIIYPGARVDVILIAGVASELASHAIVGNVRVLAVGSTTLSLGQFGRRSNVIEGVVSSEPALPPSDNYTLEVTPADADRIALAANTGTITLAMRSVAQSSLPDYGFRAPVYLSDIVMGPDAYGLGEGDLDLQPEPQSVRIIRGGEGGIDDQTVYFGPESGDGLGPGGALAPDLEDSGDDSVVLDMVPGGET